MKQRFNLFSKLYSSVFLFLAMISSSFAAMTNPFESLMDISKYLFLFGSLSWIQPSQRAYAVKFIYFIVLIVLVEYGLKKTGISDSKVRNVIAFAISAVSIIFLPTELALFAGNQYGAIAGLILVITLPGLMVWQGFKLVKGWPSTSRKDWTILLILSLAFILLNVIAGVLGAYLK